MLHAQSSGATLPLISKVQADAPENHPSDASFLAEIYFLPSLVTLPLQFGFITSANCQPIRARFISCTETTRHFLWLVGADCHWLYSLFVGAGMIFLCHVSTVGSTGRNSAAFRYAQISGANTVFLVVGGLGGIAVGELISRYDARWCIATGTLFIAVTYYWLPAAHSLGAIYLAYAALGVGYAHDGFSAGNDIGGALVCPSPCLCNCTHPIGALFGRHSTNPHAGPCAGIGWYGRLARALGFGGDFVEYSIGTVFIAPRRRRLWGSTRMAMSSDPQGENAPQQGMAAAQAVRSRFFLFSAAAAFPGLDGTSRHDCPCL